MGTDRFQISGGGERLVFISEDKAPPSLLYWGSADGAPQIDDALLHERPVPQGQLDRGERLDCLPEAGRGFTGHPALICHRADGRFVTQLALLSVDQDETLITFHLVDKAFGIELRLTYQLDSSTGVMTASSCIRNCGKDQLHLEWLSAATIPAHHEEFLFFEGRWTREFQPVRCRIETGLTIKESRSGRTSHHAPPFMIYGSHGFDERQGEAYGVHLAWSGNHRLLAERLRDGRIQIQAGELFLPGEMILAPAASYETPKCHVARSTTGTNGLTARFHPFVRETILGNRLVDRPRPVHFNTWEAIYFNHDMPRLMHLAELSAALGVERFVLDDGWFKGRHDDTAALGDWTVDREKYPDGLIPLINHVKKLGMTFGLWVEPEMANANSDLLRAHPDWILAADGRQQPLGRGQYVLDLTRPDVFDNIHGQIDALLRAYDIGYLKWDMNRDLTHAASRGRPAVHHQTQALYALMDRLRSDHPHVEIESCSSGGGRADYEILKRTDRIWTSDCNDPIERQHIQRHFSIFFPPEVMGAHVGPRHAHTTARITSLEMRAVTALFGHMGIEGNIADFSEGEKSQLATWIGHHKKWRDLLHRGRLTRLAAEDKGLLCLMVEDRDILVSAAQVESPVYATAPHLQLPDLQPTANYRVQLINPPRNPALTMKQTPALIKGNALTVSGAQLAHGGLPLPVLRAGEIALFHLQRLN